MLTVEAHPLVPGSLLFTITEGSTTAIAVLTADQVDALAADVQRALVEAVQLRAFIANNPIPDHTLVAPDPDQPNGE